MDRNARYLPSRVKTGSLSANRPSVASKTWPSAIRASRSRRSGLRFMPAGCSAGCDHASQAESGDQASPVTTPLSDAANLTGRDPPRSGGRIGWAGRVAGADLQGVAAVGIGRPDDLSVRPQYLR